jgi:uncharacterized protein (DUF433 family)
LVAARIDGEVEWLKIKLAIASGRSRMKKSLGRFVVVDAAICHGRPVFDGTRVFVSDVLTDVSRGMEWDAIIERWHGAITKEAIAEAVELASEALTSHAGNLAGASAAR